MVIDNPLRKLGTLGQSIWPDDVRRDLIVSIDSAHNRARLGARLMRVRKALETWPASCAGEENRIV